MSKTALYCISFVLAAFLVWTWLVYLPSLKSLTGEENKALEEKNRVLDSMLVSKQVLLDSTKKVSEYWNSKFLAQLSDTNKVKIKYIGIKQGVNALSRDSAYLFFIERTK